MGGCCGFNSEFQKVGSFERFLLEMASLDFVKMEISSVGRFLNEPFRIGSDT